MQDLDRADQALAEVLALATHEEALALADVLEREEAMTASMVEVVVGLRRHAGWEEPEAFLDVDGSHREEEEFHDGEGEEEG